jgi:hypothetical protein
MRRMVLLLVALGLGSCLTQRARSVEMEIRSDITAEQIWWQITEFARTRRLVADREATDPVEFTYTSVWITSPARFGRATRRRFFAEVVPSRGAESWTVRFHSEEQRDSQINLSGRDVNWEFAGQDANREQEFRRFMANAFVVKEPDRGPQVPRLDRQVHGLGLRGPARPPEQLDVRVAGKSQLLELRHQRAGDVGLPVILGHALDQPLDAAMMTGVEGDHHG